VTSPSRSRAYAVLRQQRRETASPNGPAGHWPTWKPTARPDTRPLKATRRRFCSGRCRTAAKTGRAAAPARALQARPLPLRRAQGQGRLDHLPGRGRRLQRQGRQLRDKYGL
jgi:hypothetical protein